MEPFYGYRCVPEYSGILGTKWYGFLPQCSVSLYAHTGRYPHDNSSGTSGASADGGTFAERSELQNIRARFPLPDLSFEYRQAIDPGYIELAGIVRSMQWEDLDTIGVDYSGDAIGWGLNLSTNLKIGQNNVFRGQVVYGAGIQNYMNDAPVDVAIEDNKGVAIPMLGVVAFIDHNWNKNSVLH